jgi:hypothetical protein
VSVKDDVMASQIVDSIAKNLPAIGSELEKQIRKNLPKDVEKKIPKNANIDDIRRNLPNIPGITDGGNSNTNENSNQ